MPHVCLHHLYFSVRNVLFTRMMFSDKSKKIVPRNRFEINSVLITYNVIIGQYSSAAKSNKRNEHYSVLLKIPPPPLCLSFHENFSCRVERIKDGVVCLFVFTQNTKCLITQILCQFLRLRKRTSTSYISLLKKIKYPQCLTSNSPLTVKHTLLKFPNFDNIDMVV